MTDEELLKSIKDGEEWDARNRIVQLIPSTGWVVEVYGEDPKDVGLYVVSAWAITASGCVRPMHGVEFAGVDYGDIESLGMNCFFVGEEGCLNAQRELGVFPNGWPTI